MGIEHFQLSKAGAAFRHASQKQNTKRAAATSDPSCATGAFYTSPTLGASYDALSPLTLSWNPSLSCLLPAPSLLDVYLYAPGAATPRLHMYTGVPYAPGTYAASILPRWWNATSSVSLQVMLVPSGTPPFLSPIPAGPVFTATYTAPANGSTPAAADTALNTANQGTTTVTPTSVAGVSAHPLSPGKKAAAALLPLLFVILLGFLYLKHTRARGQKKRSAWSEKLDKRMSSISADWRAITPGGAKEAVRQSIAHSRASVYDVGAIRPGAVEGEPVVMGEKPRGSGGSIEINAADLPRTTLGSGVGVGVGARRPRTTTTTTTPPDRNSRAVSFADAAHPRPSLSNSVYSRTSRAFHTASTYNDFVGGEGEAPPVPALPSPSRVSAYGGGGGGGAGAGVDRASAYSGGAERGHSVYTNVAHGGAWSSGERVEGVDGGYGARSVSPTGRVHTINYPSASAYSPSGNGEDGEYGYEAYEGTSPAPTYTTHVGASAYGSGAGGYGANGGHGGANGGSYFSPTTPTPQGGFEVYEPSADSAYNATTFGAFGGGGGSPGSGSASGSENGGGVQSGVSSPRQTAGPLTLTPEDIRRRMTMQRPGPGAQGAQGGQQQGEWRQSVDEVFGALSLMRTGSTSAASALSSASGSNNNPFHSSSSNNSSFNNGFNNGAFPDGRNNAGEDDDAGDYLFAPVQETVFAYPGTPAASSFNSTAASSPFAMPMSTPTMSPDEMLRAYAKNHTATSGSVSPANAGSSNRGSSSPSILAKALPLSLAKGGSSKASHLSKVSPLSNSTQGAEVVPSLHGTGMRVLYAQPDAESGSAPAAPGGGMIPAGPRARLSR